MGDFEKSNCAEKVTALSLTLNIVIFIIKIISAYFSKSRVMFAESMHTLADIAVTVAVLAGLVFSLKARNEERFQQAKEIEANISRMLAAVLIFTSVGIAINGIKAIITGDHSAPESYTVMTIVISAIIKEIMFRYTLKAAKKTANNTLKADAWHHRSDALSSVASLIGIIGAIMGVTLLDPIAALIVSIMIIKTAINIYKEAENDECDCASEETITT